MRGSWESEDDVAQTVSLRVQANSLRYKITWPLNNLH
jgi:hypothetical protein